jgi:flagellin
MAITINTNVSSLFALQYLNNNQSSLSNTLTRLSSGQRINDAKDDPAGLAIAQNMTSSVRGLKQGSRNGNDGISLVQTAQGAMGQIINLLQRMREISSQAASGTYSSSDLTNLNTEYQALLGEVDRVTNISSFNGVSLLNGGSVSIQIGSGNTANDRVSITLTDTDATTLAINTTDVTSAANAGTALDSLTSAISTLTTGLATLGAAQSNLSAAVQSNDTYATNLQNARSRIMDADFAEESANLAKFNILNQSNVAMLSQANSLPGLVLQLLRG